MKVCDNCGKSIKGLDYIQVTFLGRLQNYSMKFRQTVQFEFCSVSCFQEFFKFLTREEFEEEERIRKAQEEKTLP